MKQNFITSTSKRFFEDLHQDHILIDWFSCLQEQGTELELVQCNLIVTGFHRNTKLNELVLNLLEHVFNVMWDFAVVMVIKLLVLCGQLSDQSTTRWANVYSFQVSFSGNDKELLFKSQCHYCSIVFMTQFFQQSLHTLAQNRFTSSEQCLIIKCMPMMRNQQTGNIKRFISVSEKNIWFYIPDRVGSCIASLSQSPWRKTRPITFSFQ